MKPIYLEVVKGKMRANKHVTKRLAAKTTRLFLLFFKTNKRAAVSPSDKNRVRIFNTMLLLCTSIRNCVFQKLYSHHAGTGMTTRKIIFKAALTCPICHLSVQT